MCDTWSTKIMEWYLPIKRTMYVKTKNWWDAEDIAQNTFYKAIVNKEKYNKNASLKSWLFAIAFNEFRQYTKKYWKNFVSLDLHTDLLLANKDYEAPEETLDAKQIKYVMKLLPAQQRKVLELHVLQGVSFRKTATEMNISNATFFECYKLALKNARSIWEMLKESMESGEVFSEGSVKMLTVAHVAEKLNVCENTVLKRIGQKRLRAIKHNKKFYVRSTWI